MSHDAWMPPSSCMPFLLRDGLGDARIAACADVSGAGASPAAELRSAYSFGIIALAARRTPRFRLRAPTRVMAVGRDGEAGRRTTISSPTPMVPGLLTVA